ncbi:MAG TPA: hypothetical protein VFV94_14795 [Polyangiaceae bacterium]|jgi:hypothetical protein|nr:hypothetical protein [Polyangiaceae bacterium]
MRTRLFHTLIVCGAALTALPLGCASDSNDDTGGHGGTAASPADAAGAAGSSTTSPGERCLLPDGSCNEHCAPLAAEGGCLDPCFVHTDTCSTDCLLPDGECGWPPTK